MFPAELPPQTKAFPSNRCYSTISPRLKSVIIPRAVGGLRFTVDTSFFRCTWSVTFLLLSQVAFALLPGETSGAATPPTTLTQKGPTSGDVSFFTKKTRLWQGRSQIICFQVSQPVTEDRYYSFQVDEKMVHLLMPPRLLAGEKIGYLRVQALTDGKTRIGVDNAKLDVEIVPDGAMKIMANLKPQIVTPASNANVWGSFAVGVEQLSMNDSTLLPTPTLLLPNGKEIAGHVVPAQQPSPHARWVFTVNSDDLAPGINRLVALQKDDAGRELQSNPLYVTVIDPKTTSILSGLCKDVVSDDRAPVDGANPPKIVNDDAYGHGMVVDNGDEGQSWCLPLWTEEKGTYQMLVTARGDVGSDALATIAVMVDERNQVETTSRLATTEWQRIPVGHPFALEPGGHILSVRIRNGFSHGPDDVRNLYFEKYELARIEPAESQLAASGGSAGAGAPVMAMTMMDSGNGGGADDLHVAFAQNIDRQVVTGAIDLDAQCWRPDRDHSRPPRVELYVNKKLVASQTSDHPHWTVDPAAFSPGFNLLELKATLPSGGWAKSIPLRVEVPPDFPFPNHPFRPTIIFTTYDSGLCSTMTPPLKQDNPEIASFYCNAVSTVKLPDDLSGKYRVVVEARGDDFQGPPIMSVGLKNGGKETKLGDLPVGPKMGPVQVGQVALVSGEKNLTIAYTNDKYEKDQGDRNLYVRSVRLVPVYDTPDTSPPRVAIAYAPQESTLKNVDAVVANVMDNHRVAMTDLVIDDQPQHLDQRPLHGLGPVVLPLLTRDLKPGLHRLKVIARDDAGNLGSSPETLFNVSASPSTSPSKYERAVFLLNRFGYGPEPGEVAAILTMGEKPWLESRLGEEVSSPSEENEQEALHAQFPNPRDGGQVVHSAGGISPHRTKPGAGAFRDVGGKSFLDLDQQGRPAGQGARARELHAARSRAFF